jgi:hypothetical protein
MKVLLNIDDGLLGADVWVLEVGDRHRVADIDRQ